jgi:hypothetical protein
MTFLQPIVLWGLPLILLPVLIHLLNRMRHRSQPWAAMRFVISATRSSVSHEKLRQFLILLFRVLAVLLLVLFLSRPLAGGWLGWALSPAPDVIVMLLDRSASMETQSFGTASTKREQALKLLSQAAQEFVNTSHLILIESASRVPQQLASTASLNELSLTSPTDTAADIPAMMNSALNWLIENRAGTAEIWIASDLQRSNWLPDDTRWKNLMAQFSSLPQKVRFRLLASHENEEPNASVTLKESGRRQRAGKGELQFVLDLQRNAKSSDSIPVSVTLNGARSQFEVGMDGQATRWRHKIELGEERIGGWGSFELPMDANRRDNIAYFVYGAEAGLQASVISSDSSSSRFLQLAAGSFATETVQLAGLIRPTEAANSTWGKNTLVVWQEPLPEGGLAEKIKAFAEEGGVVIFFPPDRIDAQRFSGLGWGEVQAAEAERNYRILRWVEDEGPLAKTDEGLSLPLREATFQRRQMIVGPKNVLAAFEDGAPFLARQALGRGEVFFCASLPKKEWSTLSEGPVLVPMMQRLLQSGSRRLEQSSTMACGELSASDQAQRWVSLDSPAGKDIRFESGAYRSGERLVAVNRPAAEDEPDVLELDQTKRLFGDLPFQMLLERRTQKEHLQGEIWRIFLMGVLLLLLMEGILILPPRSADARSASANPVSTSRPARVLEPAP